MLLVVFPGKCQSCKAELTLDECKCAYEHINAGAERIFRVCPYCGVEIDNVIKYIDEN